MKSDMMTGERQGFAASLSRHYRSIYGRRIEAQHSTVSIFCDDAACILGDVERS